MKLSVWSNHRICTVLLSVLLLPSGALSQVLRFGVVGDSGSGEDNQYRLARQMEQWTANNRWEFLLLLGDNIYPDGNPQLFDQKCFTPYRALMSRGIGIHAALGNHDVRNQAARGGCAQAAEPRFGFAGGNDEYVLDAGGEAGGKRMARLVILNSVVWEVISRTGNPVYPDCCAAQTDRLARLKGWLSDSGRYHWNMLIMHHPLYSFVKPWYYPPFFNGHGSATHLRRLLEPLITGRVDVVFSGHDHFYQRIAPQQGIHYFVSGGGSNLRTGGDFRHPLVQKGGKINHFIDLEITRDDVRFRVVDETGQVFDQGVISR